MLAGMDPNLFHLDWDRLAEVLMAVIVLSLIIERALSVLFESRWFVEREKKADQPKPLIAMAVSLGVCWIWDFDAVSMIILAERTNPLGYLITAAVIAGGSKGSIKLFREVMGLKSGPRKELEEYRDKKKAAEEKVEAPPPGEAAGAPAKKKAPPKKEE